MLGSDDSAAVRASAAALLGRQNKWENMPALVAALRDPAETVRRRAYRAIREMLGGSFAFDPAGTPQQREADVRRFERSYPAMEQVYRMFRRRQEKKQ